MKLQLLAGVALAAVFAAGAASAQETGWYGAVDLGYHWPEGITPNRTLNAPDGAPYHWTWSTDDDWAGFVRLGYQFNPNWRAEVEGGYRPGDLTSVRGNPVRQQPIALCTPGVTRTAAAPTCGGPSGSIDSWSLMVNVLYDFAPDSWINPFLGAGVGINRLDVSALGQFSGVMSAGGDRQPGRPEPDRRRRRHRRRLASHRRRLDQGDRQAEDRRHLPLVRHPEHTWQSTGSAACCNRARSKGQYKDQSLTVGLRYSFASPLRRPRRRRPRRRRRLRPRRLRPRRLPRRLRRRMRLASSSSTSRSISTS
jgi:OOP family OmpA-OmpF porin